MKQKQKDKFKRMNKRQKIQKLREACSTGELFENEKLFFDLQSVDHDVVELPAMNELQERYKIKQKVMKYKIQTPIYEFFEEKFSRPENNQSFEFCEKIGAIDQVLKEEPTYKNICVCCPLDYLPEIRGFFNQNYDSIQGNIIILCLIKYGQAIPEIAEEYIKIITNYAGFQQMLEKVWKEFHEAANFSFISDNNSRKYKIYLNLHWMLLPQNMSESFQDFYQYVNHSKTVDIMGTESKYNKKALEIHFQKLTYSRDVGLVMKWYTAEAFLYKVINFSLRSFEYCKEFACIRFIYLHVYRAIQVLHHKQKTNETFKNQMICYRGLNLSQKARHLFQKNISNFVHNEGFLSTSLSEEVAKKFGKDLLIIKVSPIKNPLLSEPGYAQVNEFSFFKMERQVLFNPLNIFRILKVQKKIDPATKFSVNNTFQYVITVELFHLDPLLYPEPREEKVSRLFDFYDIAQEKLVKVIDQGSLMLMCSENENAQNWYYKYFLKLLDESYFKKMESPLQIVEMFPSDAFLDDILTKYIQYNPAIRQRITTEKLIAPINYILQLEIDEKVEMIKNFSFTVQYPQTKLFLKKVYMFILNEKAKKYSGIELDKINEEICQNILSLFEEHIYEEELIEQIQNIVRKNKNLSSKILVFLKFYKIREAKIKGKSIYAFSKLRDLNQSLKTESEYSYQLLRVKIMIELSELSCEEGNLQIADKQIKEFEDLLEGIDKKDSQLFLYATNVLGQYYLQKKFYEKSIKFFDQNILFYRRWKEKPARDRIYNISMKNQGICYLKKMRQSQQKLKTLRLNKLIQEQKQQIQLYYKKACMSFERSLENFQKINPSDYQIPKLYDYLFQVSFHRSEYKRAYKFLMKRLKNTTQFHEIDIENQLKLLELQILIEDRNQGKKNKQSLTKGVHQGSRNIQLGSCRSRLAIQFQTMILNVYKTMKCSSKQYFIIKWLNKQLRRCKSDFCQEIIEFKLHYIKSQISNTSIIQFYQQLKNSYLKKDFIVLGQQQDAKSSSQSVEEQLNFDDGLREIMDFNNIDPQMTVNRNIYKGIETIGYFYEQCQHLATLPSQKQEDGFFVFADKICDQEYSIYEIDQVFEWGKLKTGKVTPFELNLLLLWILKLNQPSQLKVTFTFQKLLNSYSSHSFADYPKLQKCFKCLYFIYISQKGKQAFQSAPDLGNARKVLSSLTKLVKLMQESTQIFVCKLIQKQGSQIIKSQTLKELLSAHSLEGKILNKINHSLGRLYRDKYSHSIS